MDETKRKCFKCGCSPAEHNVKLFRFPKPGVRNLIRCLLWAKYLFPEGQYSSLEYQTKIHNDHRMVCEKHFKDEDFKDNAKTQLLRTAVPSDVPQKAKQVAANSLVVPTKNSKLILSEGVPVEVGTTIQQPMDDESTGGNDQDFNETISPCGEHKRPRLDQSQQTDFKSYAQTTSVSLNVVITCGRRGIISQAVSDQVLAEIQRRIISEACSPMQDTPGPTFSAEPQFTSGVLNLWCRNAHTLAWLKKTISGLALPASVSLVVRSQTEFQKRVCCGIVIPDNQGVYEDSTFITRVLCYQNPWIDVKRWIVLQAEKRGACWFLVLSIPEDQVPTLMSSERRLSIGLGSVYVKFQGPNGRFVDVPRGWDQVTRQPMDAWENACPLNTQEATAADPDEETESVAPTADVDTVPSSRLELVGVLLSLASAPGGNG